MNVKKTYKNAMNIAAYSSMERLNTAEIINEARNKEKKIIFFKKRPSLVIIAACVLILGCFTVYAAVSRMWSNSIQGMIEDNETQAQALEENNYLTDLADSTKSVTCNGITVTPLDMIFDGTYGYVTLKVEGFEVEDGIQPMVDCVAYIGDDLQNSSVGGTGDFYPGYTLRISEEGKLTNTTYDNGENFEYKDDNNQIVKERYLDVNGAMEILVFFREYTGADVIGEMLHVDISGFLISTGKAEVEEVVDGNWNFEMPIKGNADKRIVELNRSITGTDYILTSIEITPLSIKTNFSYDGEADKTRDADLIPYLVGAKTNDDSFQLMGGGGGYGFENDERTIAYNLSSYGFAIVNPEEIDSLKYNTNPNPDEGELIWVDLK